jgi:four helix bundle protein
MGKINQFRDLVAWQRSHELAIEVLRMTASGPLGDMISIGSQMRRSGGSVPDNMAEGFGLGSRPGFLRHLRIARGSLCEFESQVERVSVMGTMPRPDTIVIGLGDCHRSLQAFITSPERSPIAGPEARRHAGVSAASSDREDLIGDSLE